MQKKKMMVWSIFSQKGGSGKSTVSIHVGVAASTEMKTALIDCDAQGTSTEWARGRENDQPAVVQSTPAEIKGMLSSAEAAGVELALIDCPPHIVAGAAQLAAVADLVIVPLQPSFPDLAALPRALDVIKAAGKPIAFVLNRADGRILETKQAIAALSQVEGAKVCPVLIGDRVAFSRALTGGFAVNEFAGASDPAVIEARGVYEWLMSIGKEVTQ